MEWVTTLLEQNEIFTPTTLAHYWDGLVTTVQLLLLSLVLGLVLAIPCAILRLSGNPWLSTPIALYVYIFRGTPLLIQLYMIYYGVTLIEGIQNTFLWPILKEPFYPALVAFMLNTAAYTTEIFRGAMAATPQGEIAAAHAYGMSRWQTLRRIILPSAFRRAIPAYANEVIFMLHATAIASVVTIVDLTGAARDIASQYYAPFEVFTFVALIYLVMTFAILYGFRQLENRLLAHLKPRKVV